MSGVYDFEIPLRFLHRIRFGRGFFRRANDTLLELLECDASTRRVLAFVDRGLLVLRPGLLDEVANYFQARKGLEFCGVVVLDGGESSKSDDRVYRQALDAIEEASIDRHSYILAIGGGALLDVVGFAAATAHRGLRLVRFPTTTLAQDDSGVGVKNGINAYGKKNWLGSFAVPYAVVNDFEFLHLQSGLKRREGLVEAVKVAVVKDPEFFNWIEKNLVGLMLLEPDLLEACVERSAIWHARHIAEGGDPFESGSSRPLDFGHWAAHKLEQLSGFELSHAAAVGVGMALDVIYSVLSGRLSKREGERILQVLEGLNIATWHEALEWTGEEGLPRVAEGLEEFREHLGGRLTVLLLNGIGNPVDVNEIDFTLMLQAMAVLKMRQPCK